MKKLFLKGKSMKPFFKEGDILVYQEIDKNNILKNDVIVFKRNKSSEPVVHRIVEVKKSNNERIFITKGDNAKYSDKPVLEDQILGVVEGKIKKGKLIKLSRKSENIKSALALIYLRTKLIIYRNLYHLSPIILNSVLSKFIKMSTKKRKNHDEYYFFNKKVAIYDKEQHNYQWIHYCFNNKPERFINFININMTENKDDVIKSNPDIIFRTEDDEGLIYNPKTGTIQILNETGVYIYKLLDGKHTKGDIITKLFNKFEIEDEDKAEKDFDVFIEKLISDNLIGVLK